MNQTKHLRQHALTGWRCSLALLGLSLLCGVFAIRAHQSSHGLTGAEHAYKRSDECTPLVAVIEGLTEALDAFAVVNFAFVMVWVVHAHQGLKLHRSPGGSTPDRDS